MSTICKSNFVKAKALEHHKQPHLLDISHEFKSISSNNQQIEHLTLLKFHKSDKPWLPSFTTDHNFNELVSMPYAEARHKELNKRYQKKILADEYNLCIPKPPNKAKNCNQCDVEYNDYLVHVEDTEHKTSILKKLQNNSHLQQFIKNTRKEFLEDRKHMIVELHESNLETRVAEDLKKKEKKSQNLSKAKPHNISNIKETNMNISSKKIEENRLLDQGIVPSKTDNNNNNEVCANQNKSRHLGSQKVSKVKITKVKTKKLGSSFIQNNNINFEIIPHDKIDIIEKQNSFGEKQNSLGFIFSSKYQHLSHQDESESKIKPISPSSTNNLIKVINRKNFNKIQSSSGLSSNIEPLTRVKPNELIHKEFMKSSNLNETFPLQENQPLKQIGSFDEASERKKYFNDVKTTEQAFLLRKRHEPDSDDELRQFLDKINIPQLDDERVNFSFASSNDENGNDKNEAKSRKRKEMMTSGKENEHVHFSKRAKISADTKINGRNDENIKIKMELFDKEKKTRSQNLFEKLKGNLYSGMYIVKSAFDGFSSIFNKNPHIFDEEYVKTNMVDW